MSDRSSTATLGVIWTRLAAMLDDTMGPAVFVMTEGRLYTATISLTVNFLAPAKPGRQKLAALLGGMSKA